MADETNEFYYPVVAKLVKERIRVIESVPRHEQKETILKELESLRYWLDSKE